MAAALPVVDPRQLPYSFEAITAQWLTAILCADHPGAEVKDFDLDRPDDGFSNRRRIFLQYNEVGDEAGLPRSVFCKACHDLPTRLAFALTGCGATEVDFYNQVSPALTMELPTAYYARYDSNTCNMLLMMKDLVGGRFFDEESQVDEQLAAEMVSWLARFHGAFFEDGGARIPAGVFPQYSRFWANRQRSGRAERSSSGFTRAEEVIPPRLFAAGAKVWEATVVSVARHDDLPQTLLHGDCHLKNWYVTAAGVVGLSDWQGTAIGHWARDVSYAVATILTVEDRRRWERQLLERYLEVLADFGGPSIGFEDAWRAYRQQMLTPLAAWTATLSPGQGEAAAHSTAARLEFVRRLSTAIDDLDVLATFDL